MSIFSFESVFPPLFSGGPSREETRDASRRTTFHYDVAGGASHFQKNKGSFPTRQGFTVSTLYVTYTSWRVTRARFSGRRRDRTVPCKQVLILGAARPVPPPGPPLVAVSCNTIMFSIRATATHTHTPRKERRGPFLFVQSNCDYCHHHPTTIDHQRLLNSTCNSPKQR